MARGELGSEVVNTLDGERGAGTFEECGESDELSGRVDGEEVAIGPFAVADANGGDERDAFIEDRDGKVEEGQKAEGAGGENGGAGQHGRVSANWAKG